ncbi:hypothetical protein FPV67DRAFT_1618811 [Lyophyllum atratum]|nr:hypothetical protein FPV67DRAFT_1618811 [Lyophyllum atratum]
MSNPPPEPANATPAPAIPAAAPLDDRLTFPPFPQAPPGVTIIAFKHFKERGIQMFATEQQDDVERDGLGIPTVELRVKHDTDNCKTDSAKRKRKAKTEKAAKYNPTPGVRKEWWEVWMENEDLKMTGPYNPHTSYLDRLYEAAADFRKTRHWPPGPTGIAHSWDQFRLFIGLLSNTPVWTRTDKPPQDSDSDSGDDEAEFEDGKPSVIEAHLEREPKKPAARARARPPYALYGVEPIPVGSDEEVKHLLNSENARREEQMVEFLNDPEQMLRVFLSSYMRKQGLIWSDRNLVNIPRLLDFWVRFLIRNRVFPEIEIDRALKRSLAVIELAQKELILTSKIAKQLPDEFSKACHACWGQKADGYRAISFPTQEDADKKLDSEEAQDPTTSDEPHAKRAKLHTDETEPSDPVEAAVERFEEDLKAANVEVIKVDSDPLMQDAEKLQGIKDNLNPDIDVLPPWAHSAEWGSTITDDKDDTDPWAPVAVDWAPPILHSLLPMLGPTALPLTHTPGAVECSVRRIVSFTPPPPPLTLPKSPVVPEEDPDAVDVELERRFAKVVLGPWVGWDRAGEEMPHMAQPRILETSRGAIRGVVRGDGRVELEPALVPVGSEPEPANEGVMKPHDPLGDDITVLVEPEVLPMLSPGLGLGGTWVQMAREQDFVAEGEKKKKKKKSKAGKVAVRYWYIDELMLILPSYHT